MKTITLSISFVALFLGLAFANHADAQLAPVSAGLAGCKIQGLSSLSDGSFQFLLCGDSPRGLYYSTNFGQSWSFATGGDYKSGAGYSLVQNSTALFLVADSAIYRTSLPVSGKAWAPSWKKIKTTDSIPPSIQAYGNRLYYIDLTNILYTLNASSGAIIDSIPFNGYVSSYSVLSIVGGNLFVAMQGSDPSPNVFYRFPINPDGSFGTRVELGSIPNDSFHLYIRAMIPGPSGELYVYMKDKFDSPSGIFRTTDQGATLTQLGDNYNLAIGACFGGNVYVVGNLVSKDGGLTWASLSTARLSLGTAAINYIGCLVQPGNSNHVLLSSYRGVLSTDEFASSSNPLFIESNTGIEAIHVNSVVQSINSKAETVVASSSGLLTTPNFTSANPTWDLACVDSDGDGLCQSFGSVAADANSPGTFYAGGSDSNNIYKGTIAPASTPPIIWTDFISIDPGNPPTFVKTSSHLPSTLIVGRNSSLAFFNSVDGSLLRETLIGNQVDSFEAISPSIFYALVSSPSTAQGLYRSGDGGNTWSKLESGVLSKMELVQHMVYDSHGDTIWLMGAAIHPVLKTIYSRILYLDNASKGGTKWREGVNPETYSKKNYPTYYADSMGINPNDGTIYIGGSAEIYSSRDKALSWSLILSERLDHQVNSLYYDMLLEGSDIGLRKVPEARCTITANRSSGRAPKNVTFKVTYSGKKRSADLETRLASKGNWQKLRSFNLKGSKTTVTAKIRKNSQVRAKFIDCMALPVLVK